MFRLTRSSRLSRRSRSVSAAIGIAAVFLLMWMYGFKASLPEPSPVKSATERLSFAKLAADEEVVVIARRTGGPATELRFRGQIDGTRLVISEVVWSETDRAWKMSRVVEVRPLAASEATGLDAVMVELRQRKAPEQIHATSYAIDYRRGEILIGSEKLLETSLANERTYAEQFPPADRTGAEETASARGVAPEAFWKWVTFEMLLPRNEAEN
jgi:hypothetical protein